MTDPTSIENPVWDMELPDAPFGARVTRVGARAGARQLGASLYKLEPGGSVSPYHHHHANGELLFVLDGAPALRTPEGSRRLEVGEVVSFLPGPEGAHRIFNPSEAPARVLVVSTNRFPEIAVHGDTGTVLAMTGPTEGSAFPEGADGPVMELLTRALEAAPERDGSAA